MSGPNDPSADSTPTGSGSLVAKNAESIALRRHRGGFIGRLCAPFFGQVTVDPEAAGRLRDAYAKGIVVHVYRARRVLDPIFALYALDRLGLPKPLWMHDHYASRLPPAVAHLSASISAGGPALLFLRRPVTLTNPTSAYSERHVEALVALQRESARPILLLPEALIWTKRAVGLRRTIIDSIFGDREAPGRLRELLGFFWQYDTSRFHVGAAVNIQAVLEREKGSTDQVIAKKIRWAILHHLSREEAIRTGPVYRTAARTRQMVLHDPAVRRFVQKRSSEGEAGATLEKRADALLRTIAADMRYGWLRVLDVIIDRVWNRIYDGIVIDGEGVARVRSAARRGPVVLVPSHKSHIDYLVLSQVFFKEGLMPPHVAAGENLNFPPIGAVLRRGGAFFLRRSFKGDKLYATVFAAYVRRLLKEGHAIEFFIEGGRSRTGKVLAPKMGMLSMCVEPVVDGAINDVSFIPVSISYEKIVEAKSYAHELSGGAKKKEDMGALLSSTKILRSKYGRVYVDFDEPISLRVFASSRGFPIASRPEIKDAATEEGEQSAALRSMVHQLGHRIVYGINRVTRVTPTSVAATVLLSRQRAGIAESELLLSAERLVGFLLEHGARLSGALGQETRKEAMKEAIGRLAFDGIVELVSSPDGETICRVGADGRRALDYYKNNVLHYFVPYAIVATAVLAGNTEIVPDAEVRATALEISRVLKLEFTFRVGQAFDTNFSAAAERLVARRAIERREGGWSITLNGKTEIVELAGLLGVFFEAYKMTLESTKDLAAAPLPDKKLGQRTLLVARRWILEGKIARAEGASQLTIETAIARFIEEGILARDSEGRITLKDEAARAGMVSTLDSWLRHLT